MSVENISVYVNQAYSEFTKTLNGEKLTPLNIVSLCLSTMQVAAKMVELKGLEKKQVVLSVFDRYIKENPDSSSLLVILPNMIDLFIKVEKQELKINMKPSNCFKLCNKRR